MVGIRVVTWYGLFPVWPIRSRFTLFGWTGTKKLKRRSILEAKGKVRVSFCTMLPYFRKSFGFWKVPRLRPFVLLVRETCRWRGVHGETRFSQTFQSKRTAQGYVCSVSRTENAHVRNLVRRNSEVLQNIGTDYFPFWTNCLPSSRERDNFVGIWCDKVIKWILRKQSLSSWNGYTWFCIVSSEGFSESGNQIPGCLKDSALLGRLNQCFSTAGPRPGTGPWHQLYRAARGSLGICHFSFLSIFHE